MKTNETNAVPDQPLRPLSFSLLSVLAGAAAGLGAVVFRGLIGLFHNLLFLGKWSWVYNANLHTPPSPWGPLVILVPVAGAFAVAFLVKTFAPEAKGNGVPEVMDAIFFGHGRIRAVVALVKSLASALSIGSGGSAGREGPIIQIGSSFGAAIGQWLRVPAWQRAVLIAGGAGGGIAATFNTPIGGLLFVLEILMPEVSARTLVPVALAVAAANSVGRLIFGSHPAFSIPTLETPYFHATNPLALLAFAGLAVPAGLAAALFIKFIFGSQDFFEQRVRGGYYRQHLLGMLCVGVIFYGLMAACGHYYVAGVGYATVQDLLSGAQVPLYLLGVLFGMKLLATALTLGSGASGGIFSPALFLGAILGCAYGMWLSRLFPQCGLNPVAFAIAGMAALVGSVTGAAIAAIVMVFEMARDYSVVLPMTVAVAISYGVRKLFSRESIYTMKLARRGHRLPDALQKNPLSVRRAEELARSDFSFVPAATTLGEFAALVSARPSAAIFLVEGPQRVVGFIHSSDAARSLKNNAAGVTLGEIADRNFISVNARTSLGGVITEMETSGAAIAFVVDDVNSAASNNIKGLISRQQLGAAVAAAQELFRD